MLKLNDFKSFEIFNFKDLSGGKSYGWRDGSSFGYAGATSSHDEENVTTYGSMEEAQNDGCDSMSCIDQAYDCGDGQMIFGG